MAQRKWQNGSYCYNNTYRREFFFRSGEEDKRIGCSQDKGGRIQSVAHCQPTRSGKEGVDYVSKFWMLMMITSCHFLKFLAACSLMRLCKIFHFHMKEWYCVGSVQSHQKSNHSKPRHAQFTQVQKYTYFLHLNICLCKLIAM